MTREAFWSAFEIKPFRPVTVHLSSGSSYLVERRESIWPAPEGDTVVIATGGEGYAMVALNHVVSLRIEALQAGEV